VEPADDDEDSDDGAATASQPTSAYERARAIITNGNISMDTKLGIFTVIGTNQPRVVLLFPTTSCSCPAQSDCYHVLAARMAVGVNDQPPKRKLNLTQLRKNVRKRPDKTSGRKRPRLQDVDVVAAGDADETTAAAVLSAIQQSGDSGEATETGGTDETELCGACGHDEPPARSSSRTKNVMWVQCEECPRWFHNVCVGLRSSKRVKTFVCATCNDGQ